MNNSEAAARIVKARLERTTLGQVAKRIRATLRPVSSMAVCYSPCTPAALLRDARLELSFLAPIDIVRGGRIPLLTIVTTYLVVCRLEQ